MIFLHSHAANFVANQRLASDLNALIFLKTLSLDLPAPKRIFIYLGQKNLYLQNYFQRV
jgi:hypothetical protein